MKNEMQNEKQQTAIELMPSFFIGLMIGTGAIVLMLIAGVIAWWMFA
jgi:hypothetical protein